jgi:predicted DNA-binding transcriptional regulator YafY
MYRNRGQMKAHQRQVQPYHIACVDSQWCLFGFDVNRKAMRTFVLARLSRPALTGRRFEQSKKFDLNEFLKGNLGVFKGQEDFEVVVELDAWAADDVRGRRLHSSQELTEMPRGMLRGAAEAGQPGGGREMGAEPGDACNSDPAGEAEGAAAAGNRGALAAVWGADGDA